LEFTATIMMSRLAFNTNKQKAYVSGVASALDIPESDVKIMSITEQTAVRRRLLAQTIEVLTSITTSPERVQSISDATTPENLNNAMADANIEIGALSDLNIAEPVLFTTPTPELGFFEQIPIELQIGAPAGLVVLIVICLMCSKKRKGARNQVTDEDGDIEEQENTQQKGQHHSSHHHHSNGVSLNTSIFREILKKSYDNDSGVKKSYDNDSGIRETSPLVPRKHT
jgi:hypothetical protein